MNKSLSITICLILLTHAISAANLSWQWAKSGTGIGGQSIVQVGTDAAGNIYVAGNFPQYPFTLDTITLSSHASTSPNSDFYIAKFDAAGNIIWAKTPGSIDTVNGSVVYQMAVDDLGNMFLQGAFNPKNGNGALVFDDDTLKANAGAGGGYEFAMKFDPNGNALWSKILYKHSYSLVFSNKSICDNSGNWLLSGIFQISDSVIRFDSTVIRNPHFPSGEAWIIKFDPQGNVLWTTTIGGRYSDWAFDMDVNSSDQIYVSGIFASDTIFFGTHYLLNSASNPGTLSPVDVYYAKYNSDGTFIWARSIAYNSNTLANFYGTIDTSESFFLTGQFKSPTLSFDTVTLNSPCHFLAKFDTTGNALWAVPIGDTTYSWGASDIKSDAFGKIYVLGGFVEDSIMMGNTRLYNFNQESALKDNFLIKLDYRQNATWVTNIGGNDRDDAFLEVKPSGNIIVGGYSKSETIPFGIHTILNSDYPTNEVFLASTDGTIGIEELIAENDLVLYPNPATTALTIRIKQTTQSKFTLSIINLMGEVVFEKLHNNIATSTIDISPLKSGMYILQIRNENGMTTKKFVKE